MQRRGANLEAMHAEALRLAALIDDVGKLAEAERPDLLISHARRSTSPTSARSAPRCTRASSPRRGSRSTTHVEPTPMHGDGRRLEQVVDNLLSNALRYTDPGGRVELHVQRASPAASSRCATPGIGITPEDLPHVFDRFWRSDRSRSRATGGSGIGLAVVRELVRAHHGRVELRSELGRGHGRARRPARPGRRCSPRRCAPCPPGPERRRARLECRAR